jgi:hypothetical protein
VVLGGPSVPRVAQHQSSRFVLALTRQKSVRAQADGIGNDFSNLQHNTLLPQ